MIRHFAIWIVRFWMRLLYRHKVYGKEHLPEGAAIIAPNHCSFIDPPIVGISYPGEVHFLARDSLFYFRPFGWLIRQLNTHPVVRGRENVGAIKKICELLEKNQKVVIFPEGTRSLDGQLQKGQPGIALLVLRTGCLVIPVYIHGSFNIWNAKQKFPKLFGERTACVFGSALDFSYLEGKDRKEAHKLITDKIMDSIANLRDWYLAGAKGTPP